MRDIELDSHAPSSVLPQSPKFYGQKGADKWAIDTLSKWDASQAAAGLPRRTDQARFYVDLAANEPYVLSNSAFFDEALGWPGVCIDGNDHCVDHIRRSNRTCAVVKAIVDACEGEEVVWLSRGVLGGIVDTDLDNKPVGIGASAHVVTARTQTLEGILDAAGAPNVIDFFSLDVEGAEWRVMQRFPFDRYRFLTITIERAAPWLHARLIANGYVWRKNVHFDSFYVHSSVAAALDAPESKYEETAAKCMVNGKGIPGTSCEWTKEEGALCACVGN